ncbi:tryptophan 2,3-dioxygenase family protein [Actinoplanes sp. KI2]|uniref:tryptophan 2,3-dioxygenase family protein n=1 Tax=Actinoplanes sp. KI2 TaxID=2983315 RepID=UPI0021D5E128|nr:tryptophan 2,3-dioxygenase family protein [Actinoplanes sp. KI2]MCU7726628.1 tryptophan 2,3-dioxygenase family protein [Actinoplanes sp. KI2]
MAQARDGFTYAEYLCLPRLLDAQRPQAVPAMHDELMFIVTHQAYELWFRLLLHELTAARDAMLAGEAERPWALLARCHTVERLMLAQMDVLDTLPPASFAEFRSALAGASGFQSVQFREIEFLSGWPDRRYLSAGLPAQERDRLQRRLDEPTLWDGFLTVLTAAGHDVSDPERRAGVLAELARARGDRRGLWRLAEALLDHDQSWSLWRCRHALLVERQIGVKAGTGGSTGASFLRSRRDRRFYPDLWEVRSRL